MRVTGRVLPVLVRDGWQVETVVVDLGTGLREWIEIRHNGNRLYCATAVERDVVLGEYGLRIGDFAEADTVDDGCE